MSKTVARIAFIPSLVWDVCVCQAIHGQNWWDEIEQNVILGAYPFGANVERLNAMGVRAVVNTCEESKGPTKKYSKFGIEQLHIPIVDFTEPSVDDIKVAIRFIDQQRVNGSVYIHCKSGRGRSATVVLCWLMEQHRVSPDVAQQILQQRRGQVLKHLFRRKCVSQFWSEIQQSDCQETSQRTPNEPAPVELQS